MVDARNDKDAVLAALDRLTAWSEMARSPQLTRFLEYIVKRRLDGDTQSIKAYSIAVDVFGRPSDFDPQTDPIVRVQARRLRALLDQYYRGLGAEEKLQITLPIGRYVPDFIVADGTDQAPPTRRGQRTFDQELDAALAAPRRKGHVTISWFVLLVIAIGVAALAYSLSTWGPRQVQTVAQNGLMQQPHLRIMEFQNLTDDPTITAAVSGLAVDLVDRLEPLRFLVVDYGGRGEANSAPMPADGYVLTGIVRRDPAVPANLQYSVILTDLSTNSVIWNRSLILTEEQLSDPGRIDRLSIDLLAVLGNPRGPLHTRARQFLSRNTLLGGENLYLCRQLFTMYRETSTLGAAERAKSCYGALSVEDRNTGVALAVMASLTAEENEFGTSTPTTRLERFRTANELLAQAVQVSPTSSFVWEQRARLYEAQGEHAQAEAAYGTSLQSNPSNMDALAAHARHMAFIGQLDQAIVIAQRALSAYTIIPDWYYGVPTLAALREGDFAKAARYAEIYARADREIGPILAIMAAQGAGQLPRVLEVQSFRNVGIITQLRRRITDSALLDRIRTALFDAGVPPMSLVTAF
jgi:tetratricopeptide (TPR) repeat protein/TolB-like protein